MRHLFLATGAIFFVGAAAAGEPPKPACHIVALSQKQFQTDDPAYIANQACKAAFEDYSVALRKWEHEDAPARRAAIGAYMSPAATRARVAALKAANETRLATR